MQAVIVTEPRPGRKPASGSVRPVALTAATVARMRTMVRRHLEEKKGPEALPGLRTDRPPTGLDFVVLAKTHKPPGRDPKRYRCPFCNHDRQFYDGRVLLCSDGDLRLIGHRCAGRHLGHAAYRLAEEDHRAFLRRERSGQLREVLVPLLIAAAGEVDAVRREHHDGVITAGLLSQEIKRIAPPLWTALASSLAAGGRGELTVVRRVIDHAANGQPGTAEAPAFRWEAVTVHVLAGGDAVCPQRYPADSLRLALGQLEEALALMGCDGWDRLADRAFNARLATVASHCRAALTHVESAERTVAGYRAFMSSANLRGVAAWLTDRNNPLRETVSFTPVPGGFQLGGGSGGLTVSLHRPPAGTVMRFPAMAALRRALDGETRQAGGGG